MRNLNKFLVGSLLLSSLNSAFAVPADWNGSLAFDTQIIKDFRRTNDTCDDSKDGECIKSEEENARFQSMILRLNPSLIVNDGVTVKAELSTGSVRTSNLGSSTTVADRDGNRSGGSYFAQTTSSSLNVNQLYAELYADTALYKIGRFSKHYGLGAVLNGGDKATDRFFSGYEGIEAGLKLGNFHLTPMWAKLHTNDPNTSTQNPNGKYDAYETSVEAVYDNPNRNMKFGVYYGLREVETNNTLYGSGPQNVTIIDVFFSKSWEKLSFQLEIPMLSGEVKNTYNTGDADFDTNAYILETKYKLSNNWHTGINAGIVKGDDAETTSFEGMYLHPNYQVAEIMFRYNYFGFNDADNYDIYNSSIVNTTYAKWFFHYEKGEWRWKLSALWAKANQVAENGKQFYNHAKKKSVTATQDQADDLGYEFDISFEYQWNPAVEFSGFLAYHVVGDYYAFSNDTEELETTNVMASGMRLSVSF